ncbi:MAG: hypothetical protein Q8R10_19880 [Pseudomonas sp.]|uniref:DUF883 family protein n=1 Tax=Pseudomonas sp. TaxID=306 RepID=UPI002734AC19|nr:hypothetical protein [Pseudomonas sp.]MDP3848684.1 hypothetical protein [Pseudomonas sp.]
MLLKSSHSQPAEKASDAKSIAIAKLKAEGIASGVSREFHNLITDIEDLIKDTATLTGDELAQTKVMLTARVNAAKEVLAGLGNTVSEQVRKNSERTNEYVHAQPWRAIGGVAAVAFVLGLLLNRRS